MIPDLRTIERNIPRMATVMVFAITLCSFALSYVVLVELALKAGIPALLAPLWPLCLDFFMVTASLIVVHKELSGENTLYAWGVIGFTTALSIAFNVIYAPSDLIYKVMYAIPPAVVFLSFELLMGLVKSDLRRLNRATTNNRVPITT